MRIRIALALILFAPAVVTIACVDDDHPTAPPFVDPAFVGTWRVRTVNGQSLPYVISQSGSSKTELSSGFITTGVQGTFNSQMNKMTTSPGLISIHLDADGGLFTIDGSAATFHYARAGTTLVATLSHDTLTLVDGSLSLAMTR